MEKGASLETGLSERKPLGQKKPRDNDGQGHRPSGGKSEKVSSDRGSFTCK